MKYSAGIIIDRCCEKFGKSIDEGFFPVVIPSPDHSVEVIVERLYTHPERLDDGRMTMGQGIRLEFCPFCGTKIGEIEYSSVFDKTTIGEKC